MHKKIPNRILCLLSLVPIHLSFNVYAHSASPYVAIMQQDEEKDLINRLPKIYQESVTKNLALAGANKSELLNAIKTVNSVYLEGLGHLLAYMPKKDLQQLTKDFILENIQLAYQVKDQAPWTVDIPIKMFLNNILPYANVTEKRDNWRRDFYNKFYNIAIAEGSVQNAVKKLNQFVFDTYNVRYHPTLREKPDQSPYESIKIGYASCTGLSILLVDVLRAVGIPARLAGIPSWPNTGGNHTWVEVWDNGWHYIGAAEPGEYDQTWFTEQTHNAKSDNPMNSIYAVTYEKTAITFPLVWDFYNQEIYAENVTSRYKN